jgi:A/G-specific adenine glycosylase
MMGKKTEDLLKDELSAERDAVLKSFRSVGMDGKTVQLFRRAIYRHYRTRGRSMAWRETCDPYRILVSEFMLQQTQVERVQKKYPEFLDAFPDFAALAGANLKGVLACWQGLGYNRRAKSLLGTARMVVESHGGELPSSREEMLALPGVGEATAGALAAFAFNRPVVFIETNIRRVGLYFFFPGEASVRDSELAPLLEEALDRGSPRKWYYALMDYGSMLRRFVPNPNRMSAHYKRQSPFEGSDRQVRSGVLRLLLRTPGRTVAGMAQEMGVEVARTGAVVEGLCREGFLAGRRGKYYIP